MYTCVLTYRIHWMHENENGSVVFLFSFWKMKQTELFLAKLWVKFIKKFVSFHFEHLFPFSFKFYRRIYIYSFQYCVIFILSFSIVVHNTQAVFNFGLHFTRWSWAVGKLFNVYVLSINRVNGLYCRSTATHLQIYRQRVSNEQTRCDGTNRSG